MLLKRYRFSWQLQGIITVVIFRITKMDMIKKHWWSFKEAQHPKLKHERGHKHHRWRRKATMPICGKIQVTPISRARITTTTNEAGHGSQPLQVEREKVRNHYKWSRRRITTTTGGAGHRSQPLQVEQQRNHNHYNWSRTWFTTTTSGAEEGSQPLQVEREEVRNHYKWSRRRITTTTGGAGHGSQPLQVEQERDHNHHKCSRRGNTV